MNDDAEVFVPPLPPLLVYPATAARVADWCDMDNPSPVIAYTPWLADADDLLGAPGVLQVHRLAITPLGGPVWLAGTHTVLLDPPPGVLDHAMADSISLVQALLAAPGPVVHLALHLQVPDALAILCELPRHQRARLATVTLPGAIGGVPL